MHYFCPGLIILNYFLMKGWFESWFNTPYYHMLYSHRDEAEAEIFITNLSEKLQIQEDARIVDLACGAGRHSVFLNKLGFNVTGIDISENSIARAREAENATLRFLVGDARDPLPVKQADIIMNLFTSFGYFDSLEEHTQLIKNCYDSLRSKGLFILDYFNADHVIKGVVPEMSVVKNEVRFDIEKKIENNRIIKSIHIHDRDKHLNFEEKVWLFSKDALIKMITDYGDFDIVDVFGNYRLDSFSAASERVIIVAQKNA